MKQTVRIRGYFALPTDLAAEMRHWPEFQSGAGYEVSLKSTTESVVVSYSPESEEDNQHVEVAGVGVGHLFHQVLGCVVHAMSKHSDDVLVSNWPEVQPTVQADAASPRGLT